MFFFIFIRHIMISIHGAKIYDHRAYTIIIIKKFSFFPLIYKNEWKKQILTIKK